MIILAVDSSSAAGSAAVYSDGRILYEAYANEGLTHSQTLLVRCDEAFRNSGTAPSDIDIYAVTAGPGSFTGLRIGMGLVKGMAFASDARCAAVPTFLALAQPLAGTGRDILTVLDARQKRVYCSAFRSEEGGLIKIMEDCILPLSELDEAVKACGLRNVLIAGDASPQAAASVEGAEDAGEDYRYVHAGQVCVAAAGMAERGELCTADELRPFYLQPSQAERNRLNNNDKEKAENETDDRKRPRRI